MNNQVLELGSQCGPEQHKPKTREPHLHLSRRSHRLYLGYFCFQKSRRTSVLHQCRCTRCTPCIIVHKWKYQMSTGDTHFTVVSQKRDCLILTLYLGKTGWRKVVHSSDLIAPRSPTGSNFDCGESMSKGISTQVLATLGKTLGCGNGTWFSAKFPENKSESFMLCCTEATAIPTSTSNAERGFENIVGEHNCPLTWQVFFAWFGLNLLHLQTVNKHVT